MHEPTSCMWLNRFRIVNTQTWTTETPRRLRENQWNRSAHNVGCISWAAGRSAASFHPCHNAEFSVMLTYNTAYDLPGPSRLQSFSLARISCTSNTEDGSKAHCSGRLITSPVTTHPPVPSARLSPPFALSLQVCSSPTCKTNIHTNKKTHPVHQMMLADTRRFAPSFRLLCARGGGSASRRNRHRYWRRQRRACCLSGDWLLGLLFQRKGEGMQQFSSL